MTPTVTATPTQTPTATEDPNVPLPVVDKLKAMPGVVQSGQGARIFWALRSSGGPADVITIDQDVGDVSGQSEVWVYPNETTTYTVTFANAGGETTKMVTVSVGGNGQEMLVFEWDGQVDKKVDGGLAKYLPPTVNGDWTIPPYFAEGEFHMYVKIRSMPVAKEMNLQYCLWQKDLKGPEQCTELGYLVGNPGATLTWSELIQTMWHKAGRDKIDWSEDRYRDAIIIKTKGRQPVLPVHDPPWSGEDPDEWFPLDWHVMVVVVEKGKSFSGWENYLNKPNPTATPTATASPTATSTTTP